MAWQAGLLNMIPQLPDFAGQGLNWLVGDWYDDRYKESVRHLRRRVFQDMVFSLKEAGLNPALAFGATPGAGGNALAQGIGPTAGGAGVGSAVAAAMSADAASLQARVAEGNAPSVRELNSASAAERKAAEQVRAEERYNVIQQRAAIDAGTRKTNQETAESIARQGLLEAQAKQAGASASQLEADRRRIEALMPAIQETGGWGATWEGLARSLITQTPMYQWWSNSAKDAQSLGEVMNHEWKRVPKPGGSTIQGYPPQRKAD